MVIVFDSLLDGAFSPGRGRPLAVGDSAFAVHVGYLCVVVLKVQWLDGTGICSGGEVTESRRVADGEGASVVYESTVEDTRCKLTEMRPQRRYWTNRGN